MPGIVIPSKSIINQEKEVFPVKLPELCFVLQSIMDYEWLQCRINYRARLFWSKLLCCM